MKKLISTLTLVAFLFSMSINAQEEPKAAKKEKTKSEKSCSTEAKKSCATEKKAGCCASKKAAEEKKV